MKITIDTTPDQDSGLQFAVKAFNASEKQSHDAEQARLPEQDRVVYVPVSVGDYAVLRLTDVLNSYAKQASEVELKDLLAAVDKLPKSARDAAIADLKAHVGA